MRIVVLAGGLSTERDVSFKTSEMVAGALRENGHQVIVLDVFMGYSDKEEDLFGIFERGEEVSVKAEEISQTAPDLARIKAQRKDQSDCFFGPNVLALCRMADLVFMGLHGANGEDGRIQATFDLFGIRYTGSGYVGSALAMDKGRAKQLFSMHGIPTPKGACIKKGEERVLDALGLTLPCIVKPCCGGSSIGVEIVHSQQEYEAACEAAFEIEERLIVEQLITGREFSVGVLDGEALPVIEIAPVQGFYDYKNKYKAGSAVETCPAELSSALAEKMQQYAKQTAEVLGLEVYSRSDFLLDEAGNMYCLEANTLPGMTPTSLLPQEAQAAGMDFKELCEKIIALSLRKYEG